jgi:hypothetical protein
MLPVSLDCPIFIVPLVFFNVYLQYQINLRGHQIVKIRCTDKF